MRKLASQRLHTLTGGAGATVSPTRLMMARRIVLFMLTVGVRYWIERGGGFDWCEVCGELVLVVVVVY
jgi:hypothetical protein